MKIDTNQIQDVLQNLSSGQPNGTKHASNANVDVSLQVDYEAFIANATQLPQQDTDSVQNAKRLLSSGQLDTPDNARRAAKNILTYGI
jgi:hypothetical protein